MRIFYRNKEDSELDWTLLASSSEMRTLQCSIENDKRADGNMYSCELLPFFELGSVHYDFYLINIRLPINKRLVYLQKGNTTNLKQLSLNIELLFIELMTFHTVVQQ